MNQGWLRINSGAVRKRTEQHEIKYTNLRLKVTITEEKRTDNGVELVAVIDDKGEKHFVDPWYLETE